MARRQINRKADEKHSLTESVLGSTVGRAFAFALWFLFALVVSIVIEWVGMLFWWDENHSRAMLQREVDYLSHLEINTLFKLHPVELATGAVETLNQGYAFLGADRWLPALQSQIGWLYLALSSAVDVTYTLVIRLATVVLALPAFVFWGLLGLIDGLVERDIRKECGGIESSFVYHHVKPLMMPAIAVSCGLYLTLPISFNPGLFFLIPQGLFFITVYFTASSFKKFL